MIKKILANPKYEILNSKQIPNSKYRTQNFMF